MLSLATDLGMGLPFEHGLRSTLIAIRLADRLGLAPELLEDIDSGSAWDAVVAADPEPVTLAGSALDQAMETVADFVDLKSPLRPPAFADRRRAGRGCRRPPRPGPEPAVLGRAHP